MAQYRLSISIASRGKGRSAVAMAAYRSGEALDDERTGERFDFTRKRGIVYSQMVLPANAPEWAQDRAVFWNRSEAADKRADAQIAREIQLSLPHELNDQQRRELTQGFSQHIAERYGIAVDTCIHNPHEQGDDRNHHAHLLLCTRPFDDEKKTGFGNKVRSLDNIARQRQEQPSENEIEQLRENWALRLNDALKRADIQTAEGLTVELDHRSYERQGIDQEPTVKEGPAATGLKRRGLSSERSEINEEIRQRNAERDQIQNQISAVQRELETLKKSIQGEASASDVSTINMTKEEELKQLEEQAKIAEFRARHEDYIQQLKEAEKVQNIGRDYDFKFADTGDLLEQQREQQQRIDLEFEDDERALVKQDLEERKAFDDLIRQQRQAMREQDAAEARQEAKRFEKSPSDIRQGIEEGREALNQQREQARNNEEIKMREEFTEFQDQRHHDRLVTLNERNDQNTTRLEETYEQEKLRVEQSLLPRQSANRNANDLSESITPPDDVKPTDEAAESHFRPKKGETDEEAKARFELMEELRKGREEREAQEPKDDDSDDWSPR